MEWLNYHHLLYFWTVVREGTVVRAAEKLQIGQPAVSTQIRFLEESVGHKLFQKQGRKLLLTEIGQTVFSYADQIFSLGEELVGTLRGLPPGRVTQLTVGVVNVMPKLMVLDFLKPAIEKFDDLKLICLEDTMENLVASLRVHNIDIVFSDFQSPSYADTRTYNHALCESAIGLFASHDLSRRYRAGFPGSLAGAPFLLPRAQTEVRRSLDQWFERNHIRPNIRGEFDDSALLKAVGRAGLGIFPGAISIRTQICCQYECEFIGELNGVKESFFAITKERTMVHPAVAAIVNHCRVRNSRNSERQQEVIVG